VKRPRIKTLPELLAVDRNAATIYLAILHLAAGMRRLATTRGQIQEICGLRERRITTAINTLDASGWLVRRYGRRGLKAWYRLFLPFGDPFAVGRKTTHRKSNCAPLPVGRKTTDSKRAAKSKNDLQENICCRSKNNLPFPKGKEGGFHTLNSGGTPPRTYTGGAALEAEKLRRIRQARSSGRRGRHPEQAPKIPGNPLDMTRKA
jgi:hypothetical protein